MKIIMGENLVYNASVQVGSHHYARAFSKENDVFWVSIPWNIFLYMKYGKKGERFLQWNGGEPQMESGIITWCPFTFVPYRDNFPFSSKKNVARTLRFTFPNLEKTLKGSGFLKCDILWITDPRMSYLAEIVEYDKLVYRCVDDLTHFDGIPPNVREVEKELVQKADVVLATAGTLKSRLEGYRPDVHSLPNAVDFDFFSAYDIEGKATEIDSYQNIVLYVGTIGEWFDCDLIRYCAEKREEYTFVLIGPQRTDISALQGVDNIKLLGPRNYQDVPLYMKKSDVGIIPFKMNDLVDAVNPLKIYEYFACGLPVVATGAKELKKMGSPAALYHDYDEALRYLDAAMAEGSKRADEYISFARDNSWDARCDEIFRILHA